MTSVAKPRLKRGSRSRPSITTAGGAIDDVMVELIADSKGAKPKVLLWRRGKATVGPRVEFGGRVYAPPDFPSSLYRATRLPSRCVEGASARELFDSILAQFRQHLGLGPQESALLAAFSICTWFTDRFPISPTLKISGPSRETGIGALRLLNCFCRHPLLLSDLTPAFFRSLPPQLSFTLLINLQEPTRAVQRLLRTTGERGFHLPGNRGQLIDAYGAWAVFCPDDAKIKPSGRGVIQVSAVPTGLYPSALNDETHSKIANDFQSRLLMYRLRNYHHVRQTQVTVPDFTPGLRPVAELLTACFPQDPELAREVAALLKPQDDDARGQRFCDVNFAIVEVLLGIIHAGKQREARVDELAKDVNALLRSRGETLAYSPEEVGWKLRGLGVSRHSSSSGRQVLLTQETKRTVHRLARAYDLVCPTPNCPDSGPANLA